jgi:prefoldin subunit 5
MNSWKAKRTSSLKKTKKFKLKNAYAQEVEKCENLTKELRICHDSISSLRTENASLVSKVKELNVCNDSISCLRDENATLNATIEELNVCKPSTSTGEHVSICTRCRDINVEAIDDQLAMIKNQNDHIAKFNAKIAEHELENEKNKFARSMLYNGRRPGIKDGIGFQQGSNVKLNAPKKLFDFVKGKAPMVQAPGIQIISKCLKRRLPMHQMNLASHLKLLMHLLYLLTKQAK